MAVKTMMCWTSRQVRHGRTCSISAIIPAARGAAADVPVWPSVHPVPFCKSQSVVTFGDRDRERPPVRPRFALASLGPGFPHRPLLRCQGSQIIILVTADLQIIILVETFSTSGCLCWAGRTVLGQRGAAPAPAH